MLANAAPALGSKAAFVGALSFFVAAGLLLLLGLKFLETNHFAGESGEAINQVRIFFGVGFKDAIKGGRIKAVEHLKELEGGEGEGGLVEVVLLGVSGDLSGPLELEFEFVEPVKMTEPILVTAVFPARNVVVGEARITALSKPIDDTLILVAIVEELVDFVADVLGKPRYFAGALVRHGREALNR